MTREDREDAIDIIQSILDKYEEDECLVTEITIGDEDIKAFKMAIKALEQEAVIDKIRAEIEQARDKLKKIPYDTGSDRNNAFIDNVLSANVEFCNDLLQILDKYKGEIEEEE